MDEMGEFPALARRPSSNSGVQAGIRPALVARAGSPDTALVYHRVESVQAPGRASWHLPRIGNSRLTAKVYVPLSTAVNCRSGPLAVFTYGHQAVSL